MPHFKSKWLIGSVLVFAVISSTLILLHLALNSPGIQKITLKIIDTSLNADVNWQKMKFNGATGHFSGENLSLYIPKSDTKVTLKGFELAFNPLALLLRKIHLIHLRADELTIELGTLPQQNDKPKKIPDLVPLISLISLDKAEINKITVVLPEEKTLSIGKVSIKSQLSFLRLDRQLNISLSQIRFLSAKFDLFIDDITTRGSLKVKNSLLTGVDEVGWTGTLQLAKALAAFYKAPNPWNTDPAWDESLTPTLLSYYANNIPDNRSFIWVDKLNIPINLNPNQIEINNANIHVFNGQIAFSGDWNKGSKAIVSVTTPKDLTLSLLPLGKSKIRRSFKFVSLNLKAQGKLRDLFDGNMTGYLSLALKGNPVNPSNDIFSIETPLILTKNILKISDLKGLLGTGSLNAHGEIDLQNQTIKSEIKGNKLDAQTIVKLFSSIDIPSIANIQGGISGELKNPNFDFKIDSENATYETLQFGKFTGQFTIHNKNLQLGGTSLLNGSGSGNIDLKITQVFNSSNQTTNLDTTFKNLPINNLLKTENLNGVVDGGFSMKKDSSHQFIGNGNIEASNVVWLKIPIGDVKATIKLKNKTLAIQPISINFTSGEKVINQNGLTFNFGNEGTFSFAGNILPNATIEGERTKSNFSNLHLKIKTDNNSILFAKTLLPFDVSTMALTGILDINYPFANPENLSVKAEVNHFDLKGDEKNISITNNSTLSYQNQIVTFNQVPLQFGTGKITLNGPLSWQGNSQLTIKGDLDLSQLVGMISWLSEGQGLSTVDLTMNGSMINQTYTGKVILKGNEMFLRSFHGDISEAFGEVKLDKSKITFNNVKMRYDDSPLSLDGWIEISPPNLTSADLRIQGTDIPFSSPETWQFLADTDLTLKGSNSRLTLAGNLNIEDGLYYKDYSLSQFVLKPIGVKESSEETNFKNLNFDMHVRSSGEFEVHNNLVDLSLKGDLIVQGNYNKPILNGNIDVLDGEIHTMGLDFENATGFLNFTPNHGTIPLIEFSASHTIQDYEVKARIKGYADNLTLLLESTPSLSQKEIFSLVAYGATPDQLSTERQNMFSTNAIASQVIGILQRPLTKATKLDIVKLEKDPTQPDNTMSRVSIGKKISDRFSLAFTTDLSVDEAQQGVVVEYQIFDNILLKGVKDTGSQYRFDLTYRLEFY